MLLLHWLLVAGPGCLSEPGPVSHSPLIRVRDKARSSMAPPALGSYKQRLNSTQAAGRAQLCCRLAGGRGSAPGTPTTTITWSWGISSSVRGSRSSTAAHTSLSLHYFLLKECFSTPPWTPITCHPLVLLLLYSMCYFPLNSRVSICDVEVNLSLRKCFVIATRALLCN